ncbi:MAG: hypothetical protein ACLTEP_08610 [Collinsella sp.]
MDWQVVSTVGSLLRAAATFFAAFVALAIGRSEHKMSVYALGIFLKTIILICLSIIQIVSTLKLYVTATSRFILRMFSKGQGLIKSLVGLKHGSNQRCVSVNAECRAEASLI